jgi:TonB-linked SusC/RagA family outer membrane protein
MKFLFPAKGLMRSFLSASTSKLKSRVMKISCFLIAFSCSGLQLLMADSGKAQGLNEVKVTLELNNEPLKTAFSKIEKQTDFRFAYNKKQIDNYQNITLAKDNYTLQKLLEILLGNTDLTYQLVRNKIIVFQKDKEMPVSVTAAITHEQDGSIKGKITNEKGEPVLGASVELVGQHKGAAANNLGEFTIAALKPGKYTLHVSGIGFETIVQEVTISDNQVLELSFQLKSNNNALNEVIVTGYSRQSKRDVTGAASTISADVVEQTPVTSVESVLEGRVAGVSVDGQGGPGSAQTVRIRGVGTLGNNDPLYVIDGVQIRMGIGNGSQNISNLLNTGEIESITILKDPSLIALYGSEGSNGVVVITTKTGKLGAPRLDYNTYIGVQEPKNLPSTITPQQQANALYNSYRNTNMAFPYESFYDTTGGSPILPDYIIEGSGTNNIGVKAGDPLANPSLYNYANYRILQANKAGTNWWKELFKPAMTQNHQLTLSGANDKSNYAVTLGFLDDQGILLNSYFKRLSLRVNTQFKIKPWLKIGENVELSYSTQNSEGRSPTGDIAALYILSPLLPKYDIAGNLAGTNKALILGNTGNPFTDRINSLGDKNYSESIVGAAYVEAEPIKGLTYTNQIGFQFFPNEYHGYSPVEYQEPIPGTTNLFTEGGSYSTDWRWLNKLSYSITLHDIHKITALVGYEARQFAFRSYGGTTGNIGFPSTSTQYLGNGNTGSGTAYVPTVSGGGDAYTNTSVFGNVTYSLYDKYLLTGTLRRDGSSKFGPDSRFGNFSAASAGWRISSEKFMDNIQWINDLKLRASYGTTGNDAIPSGLYLGTNTAGPFGAYDLAGTNTSSMSGYFPYQLGNAGLHWETNVTTNVGFDATLFKNRLNASFNWFDKKTKGLLYAPPSSGTAGSALSPYENIMDFTNKGVELELGYNGHIGQLRYDMNFNISTYRNRVDYINGVDSTYIQGGQFGSNGSTYLTRSVVGRPVSSFYGYVYEGLFQNAADIESHADESSLGITPANALGHVKYKNMNKDNVIDANDETFLGDPNPKFSYGFNLNLYYKNFDLGILLQGVYGNKIFNYARIMSQFPNGPGAAGQSGLTAGSLDTWSPTNTNAKLPIFSQDLSANDQSPSSFFIENGSYMRVKNLQLGYTISHLKGIRRLRIYVQAYNLLTITRYSGMDPEVNDGDPHNLGIDYGTAYPIAKKFLFGVNFGL